MAPGDIDSLDNDGLKALSLAVIEQNALLKEQVAGLKARVADLEARLGTPPDPPKTPGNSSVPPSKGQKANRPDAHEPKKPRKGRPGVARELCADPDEVRDVYATQCEGCGSSVTEADQPDVHAYDHIDLPPIKPVTTRVNLHSGTCRCCGEPVVAEPPADMAPGSPFGPGITAFVIYLRYRQMIGYARLVEVMRDLFGLTICEGALANMLSRSAPRFAAETESIATVVRASPVIHSDETSARVEGRTWWQWLFGSASAVCHIIVPSRGKAVVGDFLVGARPDVWLSDRLAAQCGHAPSHQFCLAHLIRDAQYAIDAGDDVFAPGLKGLLKRACAIGRRRGGLADSTLKAYRRDLDRRLDRLLALAPTKAAGIKLQATIRHARAHLFVFVTRRDVDATNNVSERGLRPSVIYRKVTNGFRSTWGAKVYADICSVIATGLLNGRTALAAIRTCLAGRSVLTPA